MKKFKKSFLAVALALSTLIAPVAAITPMSANAANPLICTVAVSTGGAVSTTSNAACSWAKGQAVLLQCTVDVNVNSTTANGVLAPATSNHQLVAFTNGQSSDPMKISLLSSDQALSLLGKASGSCSIFLGPAK